MLTIFHAEFTDINERSSEVTSRAFGRRTGDNTARKRTLGRPSELERPDFENITNESSFLR